MEVAVQIEMVWTFRYWGTVEGVGSWSMGIYIRTRGVSKIPHKIYLTLRTEKSNK